MRNPNEITLDHEKDAVPAPPLSFTAASETPFLALGKSLP